jgi:hypothetical protein
MKVFRLVLIALTSASIAAACATALAEVPEPNTSVAGTADQAAALGECAVADLGIGAPPVSATISQVDAEKAARVVGARAGADSALLTTVTLGTHANQAPTAATAARDGSGVPIVNRPAWIFVFRNLNLPRPGGIPHGPAVQAPPIMVVASVIDAQTGVFLGGWECR